MLFSITYLSHERAPLSPPELDVLVRQSARDNAPRGITGVLLYADGYFVQCLEGERDAVFDLLARIRRDARHELLLVSEVQPIERRTFEAWGMALLDARVLARDDEAVRRAFDAFPSDLRMPWERVDAIRRLLQATVY